MKISLRFDGFPLYAFVPEWMVVFYLICGFGFCELLKRYGRIKNG